MMFDVIGCRPLWRGHADGVQGDARMRGTTKNSQQVSRSVRSSHTLRAAYLWFEEALGE